MMSHGSRRADGVVSRESGRAVASRLLTAVSVLEIKFTYTVEVLVTDVVSLSVKVTLVVEVVLSTVVIVDVTVSAATAKLTLVNICILVVYDVTVDVLSVSIIVLNRIVSFLISMLIHRTTNDVKMNQP